MNPPKHQKNSTPLGEVLALLDVDPIDCSVYLGRQPIRERERLFGGQIAAQALMAAARTCPGRQPISLHAVFLRMGQVSSPVRYHVTSLVNGRTLTRRRVTAVQNDKTIFEALVSLTIDRDGPDYQDPPPAVPPPETLERIETQLASYADEYDGWWVRPRAFDMRYVTPPPRIALECEPPQHRVNRLWVRPDGHVPPDAALSAGLITYLSDLTLLDPVMVATRRTSMGPGQIASLDHSIRFHRAVDFDDWLLYDQTSSTACGGRGLSTAAMFSRVGELVCTVTQEGYVD